MSRIEQIRACLQRALSADLVEIEDESHQHAGHVGAADGRGHFRVTVVSARFEGLNRVQRHRLVYEALGELMTSDIHALAVRAIAPAEL